MQGIMDVTIRTLVGFFILLVLTRLLGKKQLGQLTIFTYITGIAIGNMAGDMIIHKDVQLSDGVIGMVLWSVLIFIVEYASLKSAKIRVALDGEPTIVIKKGQILYDQLKKMRLNMDDLGMLLRTNHVFSVLDIEYAILEPNGELSILKKPEKEQIIRQDMQIVTEPIKYLPSEIIVDGKIVHKNLKELGLDSNWVMTQLKKSNILSPKDVFYAELQSDGSLYIQPN